MLSWQLKSGKQSGCINIPECIVMHLYYCFRSKSALKSVRLNDFDCGKYKPILRSARQQLADAAKESV